MHETFPSAEAIAGLIVAAARVEGECPVAVAQGRKRSRARVYAFIVLCHYWRHIKIEAILKMLGVPPAGRLAAAVYAAQTARRDATYGPQWFDLAALNRVVAGVGWPAMSQEDAEVRRYPRRSRPVRDGGKALGVRVGNVVIRFPEHSA